MGSLLKMIDIEDLKNIALKAGEIIMQIYKKDFSVEYKDDKSPLTLADLKSNEYICSYLQKPLQGFCPPYLYL